MHSPLIKVQLGIRLALFSMLAGMTVACGSGGGSGGGSGNTGGGGSVLQANFDSIQQNVFDARCIVCHIGASAPLGLRLDDANSYGLLVGVASAQVPALQRVDPGDPNSSYLIQKLEGTASAGGRMPLGATPLSQADIAVVRQWITDGAQPGQQAPPADPIRVSSMSPLPGNSEPVLPMSIMAMFDRELDVTSVNEMTFLVERSGGDGTFGDGNEVTIAPVSVTVPGANPMTAVLDLSTTASVEDTYRVSLAGTGPVVVLDLDGNALDGEFGGSLPSGDGTQGGSFVMTFDVVGIQATLQSIQDHVFTPICSGCHTGPTSNTLPSGMDLTSIGASFMALVGVASIEQAGLERVDAGDPDNSYLIHKLEGTAASGNRMPPFGNALDAGTIDAIRQWIGDGAAM